MNNDPTFNILITVAFFLTGMIYAAINHAGISKPVVIRWIGVSIIIGVVGPRTGIEAATLLCIVLFGLSIAIDRYTRANHQGTTATKAYEQILSEEKKG